jgi:hypothetical protein
MFHFLEKTSPVNFGKALYKFKSAIQLGGWVATLRNLFLEVDFHTYFQMTKQGLFFKMVTFKLVSLYYFLPGFRGCLDLPLEPV